MAVNDGLTVFNLVDGVVDEFHDESGTDEGERGSNDTYDVLVIFIKINQHLQHLIFSRFYYNQ